MGALLLTPKAAPVQIQMRLRRIKAAVDPAGVFRGNHPIEPG